jgi:hypothetical protein
MTGKYVSIYFRRALRPVSGCPTVPPTHPEIKNQPEVYQCWKKLSPMEKTVSLDFKKIPVNKQ